MPLPLRNSAFPAEAAVSSPPDGPFALKIASSLAVYRGGLFGAAAGESPGLWPYDFVPRSRTLPGSKIGTWSTHEQHNNKRSESWKCGTSPGLKAPAYLLFFRKLEHFLGNCVTWMALVSHPFPQQTPKWVGHGSLQRKRKCSTAPLQYRAIFTVIVRPASWYPTLAAKTKTRREWGTHGGRRAECRGCSTPGGARQAETPTLSAAKGLRALRAVLSG
jgi:hypothetical protein